MARFNEREEDLENALNRGSLWAITYGDLMSYLMIFFLLMFVFATSKSVRLQMGLHSVQSSFGGKKKMDLEELFSQRGIKQFAQIEVTEERVRITFSQPILFDSGRAVLKQEGTPILHRVANIIKDIPNEIMIEGHTDNVPVTSHSAYRTNWELSTARAHSVLEFFIREEGVSPSRMVAIGYGEYRPIQSNETPEGQAANRRIEISIRRLD